MLPLQEITTLPLFSLIPPGVLLTAFILLLILVTALKAFALWHAARNHQTFWFVMLLVLNTLGILEIIYLLAFRKDKQSYAAASETPTLPIS